MYFPQPKYAYSHITGSVVKFLSKKEGVIIIQGNNTLSEGVKRNDFHNYDDEHYWIHLPYCEVNQLFHMQPIIFYDKTGELKKGFFNYFDKNIIDINNNIHEKYSDVKSLTIIPPYMQKIHSKMIYKFRS